MGSPSHKFPHPTWETLEKQFFFFFNYWSTYNYDAMTKKKGLKNIRSLLTKDGKMD